ncbi:hypothetical protein J6590_040417 [Homalodisca vitripennis]|nr:hypothetical protein J6590_040417 [Homalodisca vitripennis]
MLEARLIVLKGHILHRFPTRAARAHDLSESRNCGRPGLYRNLLVLGSEISLRPKVPKVRICQSSGSL